MLCSNLTSKNMQNLIQYILCKTTTWNAVFFTYKQLQIWGRCESLVIDLYDNFNVPLLESGRHNYVQKCTINSRPFGVIFIYRPTYRIQLELYPLYVGALTLRSSLSV
jgi:hypothetical protein